MTIFEGRGFAGLFSCLWGYTWDDVYHGQSLQRFNSDGNRSGEVLQGEGVSLGYVTLLSLSTFSS